VNRGPIIKDPRDVVHEVSDLERYLDEMFEQEGLTFDTWMATFGSGFYRARNLAVVELVRPLEPRRVLEFACAGGHLAELVMDGVPTIDHYVCSSVSARVVEHAKGQLQRWPHCAVKMVDADLSRSQDMVATNIATYDLFLTTSFEHIRLDRELICEMPPGAAFVFSVTLFDDPEHFRVFGNETELRERYEDLLAIDRVVVTGDNTKIVVSGRIPIEPSGRRRAHGR